MTESTWHQCPNCKSITVTFDPPIEIEITNNCPAKHKNGYFCDLEENHEGKHMYFLDCTYVW